MYISTQASTKIREQPILVWPSSFKKETIKNKNK